MATWIAHLRVAENILNSSINVEKEPFVAGNIAPDAGVPNDDWSEFCPPPDITHWKNSERKIMPENFFDKYVLCERASDDKEYYSFALGYYVHLLTDVEWELFYSIKKEDPLYKENLQKDPKFIWRIKDDWYGQDFVYLNENEDSLFFSCFQHLVEINDYLDYFPEGAFTNRFKYIREMYLKYYKNPPTEFIYLSEQEMNTFVVNASLNIINKLKEKATINQNVELKSICSL